MTAFLAAVAFGVAAYLWATKGMLPSRPAGTEARRTKGRSGDANRGWSVTLRSCKVLGISPARLKVISWVFAGAVGLGWSLIVQNPPAGIFMGMIGYQLPGFFVELKAAGALDRLQRQVSTFVGGVNDALHGRGATAEDAMLTAALAVTAGPLQPIAKAYLEQTEAGVAFADRVRMLGSEVDLPSFNFFAELMQLRENTGVERMAKAFDLMDEKFREDERIQAAVRGELGMYMSLLIVTLLINVAVFPLTRVLSTDWSVIHAGLGFLVTGSALGSAVVFSGVRRFARARVSTS